MANEWIVKFTDDDEDSILTASFSSKREADLWISNQEVQGRYDPNGFEVVEGPYREVNGKALDEDEGHASMLWIDDIRPAPHGYIWLKSVDDFIDYIAEHGLGNVAAIDLDHDAGDYYKDGGDYIKCLDYLESIGAKGIAVRLHSSNPAGVKNMRLIILKNGWQELHDIIDDCELEA